MMTKTLFILNAVDPKDEAFELIKAWFRNRTGDTIAEVKVGPRLKTLVQGIGRFAAVTVDGGIEAAAKVARSLKDEDVRIAVVRLNGGALGTKIKGVSDHCIVVNAKDSMKVQKHKLRLFSQLESAWNEARRTDGGKPTPKPKLPWEG